MPDVSIPCVLYRGGTSRGLLFLEEHLPYSREALSAILLRAFGSPDVRQIDGIGGGTSLTSKALIVGPDRTPEADVRMLFAQVGVAAPTVDWGGICGNMTAAVGPFAIESGLVPASEPITSVNIRSVNTGVLVRAHVPVRDGRVCTDGDYSISGVCGASARIDLEWLNPGGSATGRLLPTGRVREELVLSGGRRIEVSIVDAANPIVFCTASALGLKGTELPAAIESQPVVMQLLEQVRSIAAEILGIVPDRAEATRLSPGLPKVAFVAPPAPYQISAGDMLTAETHDLQARYMSMQTAHRAYAGGGAICTAVAALLPGTVVHDCTSRNVGQVLPPSREASADRRSLGGGGSDPATGPQRLRIGHPAGVMDVRVNIRGLDSDPHVVSATVARTARRIMSGAVWVPESLVPQLQARAATF